MPVRFILLFTAALLLAGQDTTFLTDVKVVNVFATVRDKHGRIVRDLSKDDFTLEEDGRPQAIRYFSRETNLPLTLGLLIDSSGSQRRVLPDESRASYQFLGQVLREEKDQAFVIHFDREVELLQDLTPSRKKLEAALALLESPDPGQWRRGGARGGRRGGGTSLYDAVLLASDELMKKQSGRKALILLSDGMDNGSKITLANAIESAERADTLVYSILFADPDAYQRGFGGGRGLGRRGGARGPAPRYRPDGKKILEQISKETGGGFYEVSKKAPIEQVFNRIEEELRNQYSFGYTPQNAGAGLRKIHLAAKSKNLTVQARDAYYADK